MTRRVEPLPIYPGSRALAALPMLRRGLDGAGAVLCPHPGDQAAPALPEYTDLLDEPGLILRTSGSTRPGKRAVIGFSALHASARANQDRLGGPATWLLTLSTQHVAGIMVLVRSLLAGTQPVAMDNRDGFAVKAFAAAAARLPGSGPFDTALVPTQLRRILDSPAGAAGLRRFRTVLVGGAATDQDLLQHAWGEGVHVITTYGMSESGGGCVYDGVPLAGIRLDLGAARAPVTGRAVTTGGLSGRAGSGRPTGREEQPRRIRVAGPVLAAGYLGEPERTARTFVTDRAGVRWLITDDVGWYDERGRLVVHGRLDDVVITGGIKVWPAIVEEALGHLLPLGAQAVVVGLPDPEWGEVVAAAVVLPPREVGPALPQIRRLLRGGLPAPALPRVVAYLPELPQLPSGKLDRERLRALLVGEWAKQRVEDGDSR
ncbi:MAG TPA: AMP-binding protein [Dermatophilaceae bacterium]|nr:AMP-binding protein [Dermatophilaceae bacterium]